MSHNFEYFIFQHLLKIYSTDYLTELEHLRDALTGHNVRDYHFAKQDDNGIVVSSGTDDIVMTMFSNDDSVVILIHIGVFPQMTVIGDKDVVDSAREYFAYARENMCS